MFKSLASSTAVALMLTIPAVAQGTEDRLAALEQLMDRDAIKQLIIHYGRANDIIGRGHADREAATAAAVAEYELAFTPDATVTVYPLGSDTPLQSTNNIADWSAFVGAYFVNQNYSSTLHLMGNHTVEFTGDDTAEATAFAINPHFILSPEVDNPDASTRVLDLMNVRYEYGAARQDNGEWRITEMTIYLDEIMNGIGFFGAGQRPG